MMITTNAEDFPIPSNTASEAGSFAQKVAIRGEYIMYAHARELLDRVRSVQEATQGYSSSG